MPGGSGEVSNARGGSSRSDNSRAARVVRSRWQSGASRVSRRARRSRVLTEPACCGTGTAWPGIPTAPGHVSRVSAMLRATPLPCRPGRIADASRSPVVSTPRGTRLDRLRRRDGRSDAPERPDARDARRGCQERPETEIAPSVNVTGSPRGPTMLVSARPRVIPVPGPGITGDTSDFFLNPPFLRQGASQMSGRGVKADRPWCPSVPVWKRENIDGESGGRRRGSQTTKTWSRVGTRSHRARVRSCPWQKPRGAFVFS